jgi:hypothetical protein
VTGIVVIALGRSPDPDNSDGWMFALAFLVLFFGGMTVAAESKRPGKVLPLFVAHTVLMLAVGLALTSPR